MSINGRRAKWLVFSWLLILAALLFRPVRCWFDEVIFARAIHPNLKFSQLNWRRENLKDGVLLFHAKNVDWGAVKGERGVGLTSDDVWITLESRPLLNKQFFIPRAVMPNARLTLVAKPKTSGIYAVNQSSEQETNLEKNWLQSLLASPEQSFWPTSIARIERELQIEDLLEASQARIQQWVSESDRLLQNARQLVTVGEGKLNSPIEVTHQQIRSDQITQLIAQEQLLADEFSSLEKILKQRLQQIRGVLEEIADEVHSTDQLSQSQRRGSVQQQSTEIAKHLVEAVAHKSFDYVRPYAEVADLLYRAAIDSPKAAHNRNYRPAGMDFLTVDSLIAKGIFQCESTRSPFQLHMHCKITHQNTAAASKTGQLNLLFPAQKNLIDVRLTHQSSNQQSCHLAVALSPPDALHDILGTDRTGHNDGHSNSDMNTVNPFLNIECDGRFLSGSLLLDDRVIAFFSELVPELYGKLVSGKHDWLDDIRSQQLEVQVEGTWSQLRCQLKSDAIPHWLLTPIQELQMQHLEREQQEKVALYNSYIHYRLDALDSRIQEMLDQAGKNVVNTCQSMLAIRGQLQTQNTETRQVEFARSEQDELQR